MEHHALDPYPIPKEESPMYINEPWLIDKSLLGMETRRESEDEEDMLISQIEIYDQRWYVRHMPKEGKRSLEAIELVREFVSELEQIPDGGAECFPFETIDELKSEYLSD